MEGQWVMMAVRCMGKMCKNCQDLKIDSEVIDFSNMGEEEKYEINLYCRNVGRCERISEMIEKGKK